MIWEVKIMSKNSMLNEEDATVFSTSDASVGMNSSDLVVSTSDAWVVFSTSDASVGNKHEDLRNKNIFDEEDNIVGKKYHEQDSSI